MLKRQLLWRNSLRDAKLTGLYFAFIKQNFYRFLLLIFKENTNVVKKTTKRKVLVNSKKIIFRHRLEWTKINRDCD